MPEVCDSADDDCDSRVDEGGVCTTFPPTVMCPSGLSAAVLSTVTLAGGGSDPDGGAVTYSWTVTSRPTGSTSTPTSPTSATTSFFLDAAGTYTVRFCVRDNEGEMSCCDTTIVSTPPGVLHVEMSWAEGHGDADLHVRNVGLTGDTGWYTINDCFFGNRTPDWGAAGAVANPTLDVDDRDGFGPENVTITNMPQSGWYAVAVHNYCSTSAGGTGPIDATVRIYCMGALVGTYTGISLDETDDWVTVAEVEWSTCRVRAINRSTNGSAIMSTAHHCEIRCATNADCPTGERCVTVGGGGPPRLACVHL
jgi:hypothetical protein